MYQGIRSFARQLRNVREAGDPGFVVFLGAGASLASGSPAARRTLYKFLSEAGIDAPEAMSDEERVSAFYQLVDQASEQEDYGLIPRYQRKAIPPSGYKHLARLVADGYLRTIISTGFDSFVEDALYDAGLRANDLLLLDASYEKIPSRRRMPQVRVVKLHGDPYGADFLSTVAEVELTPMMADLLAEAMAGHVLMVGYHPRDGIINPYFEQGDGATWYVNPDEPGPDHPLALALANRGAQMVTGDAGYPDRFFGELADLLLYQGAEIQVAQSVDETTGGSVVGIKFGKIGGSVAQVTAPRRPEASELEALELGPIIGLDEAYLEENKEYSTEVLIASLERQREALEYDWKKLEMEIARYGLKPPASMLNERESIQQEIARIDKEIDRLSSEVA